MNQQSLKSKAFRGAYWNVVERLSVQASQFVVGIILARLLMPSDYGLIGMLSIFIAVSQIIIDSGMGRALIQKKDRTGRDFATVFFFNIAVSTAMYIILFISSPYIAAFYDQPELTLLTRILTINIIINSFATVQHAIRTIEMDFKTFAKINFISVIIGGCVGITMAYYGMGVWSLVVQNIVNSCITVALLWIISPWKPSMEFSKESFKRLFGFGSKLLGAGLYSTLFKNIYNLIIGKAYNAQELGYYTRGMQFAELASGSMSNIVQSVTFPILSQLQDDKERLASVYRKLIGMTSFIVFPVMTLLAVLAHPLVIVLLTEKWLPVVPLLQWLCFARVITPISSLNMNILNAIGRSDLFLKVDLSKMPLLIITLAITIPISVKAVVIGHVITSLISYFINAYYPGRLFGIGALKQIIGMKMTLAATAVMAAVVSGVLLFISNEILKLGIGITLGVTVFTAFAYIFKIPEFMEVLNFLPPKKSKGE